MKVTTVSVLLALIATVQIAAQTGKTNLSITVFDIRRALVPAVTIQLEDATNRKQTVKRIAPVSTAKPASVAVMRTPAEESAGCTRLP